MKAKKAEIVSFSDLINALEHIELDQIHSDIPANVRAELTHMKDNVSAILSFLGNGLDPNPDIDPDLLEMISTLRHECMSLHAMISRTLLLQFFRLNLVMDLQYAAHAGVQYQRVGRAICQVCEMIAPQFGIQLGSAL